MQTTLRLDDDLYRRAKAEAASEGISLTRLVEDALREKLAGPAVPKVARRLQLPVSSAVGGLREPFRSLEEAIKAVDLERDRRTFD
jgi:hypothetical protein